MIEALFGRRNKKKEIAHLLQVSEIKNEEILACLESHQSRPITKKFQVGDLVTQDLLTIDSDGEPMVRYKYPLMGQPAKVVGLVPKELLQLKDEKKDSTLFGIDDMVIATHTGTGLKEFLVSSRFFRKFHPESDTQTNPDSVSYWKSELQKMNQDD